LDWLLAGTLALAAIVAAVGIDFEIGGISVRSHSALRVLVVAAVLAWVRLRMGIDSITAWVTRIVVLAVIFGSVGTWFRFLLTTIGGADSYGYVSAAHLLGSGRLIDAAPIAEWLSASNRLALASPLGWAPAPDGSGIVPAYPLGWPFVMAAFSAIAGSQAVFFVAPLLAIVTLVLVYRLTREWFDEDVALLSVAIVAWNPVFVAYAKQPMSDVPATFWLTLATWLAFRAGTASGFVAGVAAGVAVITRPALLVAAAVVPLVAWRGDSPRQRLVITATGAAIGVAVQMALQAKLFGSPFATGYGSADLLFSTSFLPVNLGIYARQIWIALGALWLIGLAWGVLDTPAALRWRLLAIASAVALPYLFYLPFDHWETLRFLLPGLVPLSVMSARGLLRLARIPSPPLLAALFTIVFAIGWMARSELLLRQSSAWDIQSLEARYPLAGEWLNVNTPPDSIALAFQHSGSLRWYGKRQTLRWDLIEPERLVTTVRELESRGATVYVALEGDEVAMFEKQFAGVIDQLQVDHVGRIGNVHFRRLMISER